MQWNNRLSLLLRICIPLLVLVALNISHVPHGLTDAWRAVRTARREAHHQDAAASLREVLAYQPWRVDLWEQVGQAELSAGHPDRAVEALIRAEQAGALSAEGQYLLGEVYEQQGQDERAEAYWQALLSSESALTLNQARIYERLARLQRKRGAWPEVVESLRRLRLLEPDSPSAAYGLGLHLLVVEPDAALAALLDASRIDSAYTPAVQALRQALGAGNASGYPAYGRLMIGRALGSLGEWDLAAASFREALAVSPDYAEAWAFLGEANHHLGQGGKTELDQAVSLAPESPLVRALLSLYWRRHGDPQTALSHLEAIAAQEPDEPIWQVEIANTLVEQGDLPGARRRYERAVEMASDNTVYWQYLARFSIQYQVDVRELGLEAARRAVVLAPNDADALDVMGTALLSLGDLATAERFLQRALDREPTSGPVLLHLGQLYLQRQEVEQAHIFLQRASQQAGEEMVGVIARRLLEQYFGKGGS